MAFTFCYSLSPLRWVQTGRVPYSACRCPWQLPDVIQRVLTLKSVGPVSPRGCGGSEGGRTPSALAAACLPPSATLSPGALFLFSGGAPVSWDVGRQGKAQVSTSGHTGVE